MAKNDTKAFSAELLDQLLAGRNPKTVLDSGGLLGELKKALAERVLNAEMDVQWFRNRIDAKIVIESFGRQYNEVRPHSSLEMLTPMEFKQKLLSTKTPDGALL